MPLFDYQCEDGHVEERLFQGGEDVPAGVDCLHCGKPALRLLSMPSFTPGRWGDQTGKYGVNGHYDKGLGARYQTSAQRDRIMEKKGLVHASDTPRHFIEDKMEAEKKDSVEHSKTMSTYKSNLKKYGDRGVASAKTFSISQMKKSGALVDSSIKGE